MFSMRRRVIERAVVRDEHLAIDFRGDPRIDVHEVLQAVAVARSLAYASLWAERDHEMRDIRALTSLRFAAALWVFVFHIDIRWPLGLPEPLASWVKHGAVGMSLFFILSGFILGHAYTGGIKDERRFFVRRFARIYPLYTFAAVLSLPFLHADFSGLVGAVQIIFIAAVSILMLQAWLPALLPYWNFGGSWSLSAEAFFYLSFPFLYRKLNRLDTQRVTWCLVAFYMLAIIPGLSYLLIPNSPQFYYSMPVFRLPEFAIGVACAILMNRGWRIAAPTGIATMSVAVLAGGLWLLPTHIYVTSNFLAVPCIALLIAAVAQMGQSWLDRPIPVLFGAASYAFYSFQAPVIFSAMALAPNAPSWPVLAACFVLNGAAALAGYLWVERPMRNWINASYDRRAVESDRDAQYDGASTSSTRTSHSATTMPGRKAG